MVKRLEFSNYPDAADFVIDLLNRGYVRSKEPKLDGEFAGREVNGTFVVEWVDD